VRGREAPPVSAELRATRARAAARGSTPSDGAGR